MVGFLQGDRWSNIPSSQIESHRNSRMSDIMYQQALLLVDDEPSFLHGMRRSLRQEPYRILMAKSGPEALAMLKGQKIQVVVSDYRMPKMDGLSLLKRIREAHPLVILIMLTGYAEVGVLLQAINEVDLFKFLLKPVRLDLLKRAVADAMKQAQFHESCLASPAAGTRQMLSAELEKYYPGITHLPPRDKDGYYLFGSDSGS